MKKAEFCAALAVLALSASVSNAADAGNGYTFKPGHPSLKEWMLPSTKISTYPEDNKPNQARVALGKALFFDPRLSGEGNMSCATCHNPALGWSDGLPTAKGFKSSVLGRASPTIFNTGFNTIHMWDGRKPSLEAQAMGPMEANVEMNTDTAKLFQWLNASEGYKAMFAKAYPGRPIDADSTSKAIASFERTVVSSDSPFDRWVKGDGKAMSAQQVNGFKLFVGKANCAACHSAPNFTDNGFHNLGLASWGGQEPDMGRYAQKPVGATKGAFKTPTVREIARTGPYFHDGSSKTLLDVVEHYDKGGVVKTNLSPDIKPLGLSMEEKLALVSFMEALSSPYKTVSVPELPQK